MDVGSVPRNVRCARSSSAPPRRRSSSISPGIYDKIDAQPERPGNLQAAEDGAREVTEQLSRDVGYQPIYVGGIDKVRLLKDPVAVVVSISEAGLGSFFYRMWSPVRTHNIVLPGMTTGHR